MPRQHKETGRDGRHALIHAWRNAADHGLDIPDPDEPRPLGDDRCVFVQPVLSPGAKVAAGRYSYYDASEDTGGFEEERVLYAFGPQQLRIGKFCSIAAGVTFVMAGANHVYDGPTTFPFATFPGDWQDRLIDPLIERGPVGKGDTVIGNDVWIGRHATIMPGVTVADGAIIGAGAVVASDVGSYQIVAGNPARAIRSRYAPHEVGMLLTARWWDWPIEVVSRHLPELVLGTPGGVLAVARAERLVSELGSAQDGRS
ncbi:CatB-related O-acetyltransferase [Streptomyces fulvorobeus]|uniref:Acetyltransferase n=1 Tax=Streptomyces fulvorobeus TaxID=284028 RepID=A0A7J0BYA3_9ACTN|nr:CatB-related O-acetyltransferase [Streptomyces fulvorobeus]NYE39021.1 virginiamycin A acetyltransferase [Streptomyces fulvorobeus]GFM95210.1 acetyltransferase [Streptomyces fulvorobeus]